MTRTVQFIRSKSRNRAADVRNCLFKNILKHDSVSDSIRLDSDTEFGSESSRGKLKQNGVH